MASFPEKKGKVLNPCTFFCIFFKKTAHRATPASPDLKEELQVYVSGKSYYMWVPNRLYISSDGQMPQSGSAILISTPSYSNGKDA